VRRLRCLLDVPASTPAPTLRTGGHHVELHERYDFLTHAPIVIEHDVWSGAAATVTPGVTIGHGSVIGAGAWSPGTSHR
jgi:acetyltransferase-like isoleucine patch superfamily enzyme